jgi:hypothetical protein
LSGSSAHDARMTKTRRKKSPQPCPKCGSHEIVPIMYGLPGGPEVMEAAKQGKIALGGCCIGERDPQKHCNACGTEFEFRSLQATTRHRLKK